MDDFNISSLHESRNEWISRLITLLTPNIFTGLKNMLNESIQLSSTQNQSNKYLMTFQNLLVQVPKWNNQIIQDEVQRIQKISQCNYIEDLITCVHIIQLKALTCVRVGLNEKNVNINIPKLNDYIHRVYITTARAIYSNIYLFEQDIMPLQIQQNYNKVDHIIKESIIESVRQSMPIDEILRSYLEDSISESVDNNLSNESISSNITQQLQNNTNTDDIQIDSEPIQLTSIEPIESNNTNITIEPLNETFQIANNLSQSDAPTELNTLESQIDNFSSNETPLIQDSEPHVTFNNIIDTSSGDKLEEITLNDLSISDIIEDESIDKLLDVETLQ